MQLFVAFASVLSVSGNTILSSFKVAETESAPHLTLPYTTKSETFRTTAFPLEAGGVVFTDKDKTVIEFPKPSFNNQYAITGFAAEMVDEDGNSVPLNELYLHHWLVYRTGHSNMGVCGSPLDYVFGVGAESRTSPVAFPDGHGYVATNSDRWTLNVHALRTVGLKKLSLLGSASEAVKECIECNYAAGKGCSRAQSGDFQCCMDGSQCPVDGSVSGTKKYAFQYTVTYTTDVSAITPLHFYLLDGSNCQIEHNIPANNNNPVHVTQHSWKSPANSKIVMGIGHIHIGGVNVSLFLNGEELCTTTAQYGTDASNTPGNEKGYLVAAEGCTLSYDGKAGDTITVRSHYWVGTNSDPLNTAVPPGAHGGVMDYMYLAVVKDSITHANGTAVDLSRSHDMVFESTDHPENLRDLVV